MTANGHTKSGSDILSRLLTTLQSVRRVAVRIALGALALLAAGIVAAAMAVLGLLIAFAALIFRFSPRQTATQTPPRNASGEADAGVTLEARRTAQGWTVE